MCGLNALLIRPSSINDYNYQKIIHSMNDLLIHRGPDSCGVVSPSRSCLLGHTRLSIIDITSASDQPLVSPCGRYTLVFNGEIYNYKQLAHDLDLDSSITSDTHVLLQGLIRYKESFLQQINGIFSLLFYDSHDDSALISRDRFGVKPCYYMISDDCISVSSEIKAFKAHPLFHHCAFNTSILSDFFTFLCVPGNQTFFENIFKLEPGTYIYIDSHRSITCHKYHDFLSYPVSTEDLSVNTLQNLNSSVTNQLVADVDIGILLSGGVDSNALLALSASQRNLTAFSVEFSHDTPSYSSELSIVQSQSKIHEVPLHSLSLTPSDFLSVVDEILYFQDEPLADPVSIPLYHLSKLVRDQHIKVVLAGEGADEVFFGYSALNKILLLHHLSLIFRPIAFLFKPFYHIFSIFSDIVPSRYLEHLRRYVLRLPQFYGGTDALTYHEKSLIGISTSQLKMTDNYVSGLYNRFTSSLLGTKPINWFSYLDLVVRLPELMLMRIDKMAMSSGVEARVPFLDNQLVLESFSIASTMKLNRNINKYTLKNSLSSILPSSIINAKKQGFNAPAEEWCLLNQEYFLGEIFAFCDSTKLLDYTGVQKLVSKSPRHLWRIFVLARWHRNWFRTNA